VWIDGVELHPGYSAANVDGPSRRVCHLNGRVFGIRWKESAWGIIGPARITALVPVGITRGNVVVMVECEQRPVVHRHDAARDLGRDAKCGCQRPDRRYHGCELRRDPRGLTLNGAGGGDPLVVDY
jgi:hypothetical protein